MPRSLYILDGHAQIYRAYYAVLGLRSPSGEPTNATFGFVGMLLKLLQGRAVAAGAATVAGTGGGAIERPTHVVLTMDAGTSGREAMDAAYKAQRKPMPEDMPAQIDRILQIAATIGMPLYQAEGYEADDAMATLIRQVRISPECSDCKIYMCTKDKDLDQLIDEQCVMYDIQTNEEINAEGLKAKKGFLPTQARDVLALTGDAVDNIPGIPGVGPKTAAKWIGTYGSIDNLIAHKEEIGGKIGEAFRANLHVLENSRKLVELQFDVPIPAMDWDLARVHPEKLPALAPIFRELGFNRLLDLLEQVVRQYRGEMGSVTVAPPSTGATPPAGGALGAPQARLGAGQAASAKTQAGVKPKKDAMAGGLFDQGGDSEDAGGGAAEAAEGGDEGNDVDPKFMAPREEASGLRAVEGEYVLVNTPAKLEEMLATLRGQLAEAKRAGMPGWLAVDTETDALGSMASSLCGISLSAREGTGFYVAVKGAMEETLAMDVVREKLGPLLADGDVPKVGQNIKYDVNALRNAGMDVGGVHFDTMVASYVIDSSRLSHGMDALAADLLGVAPIPITDLIGKGREQISFADVPLSRAAHYSAEDADVTLRLAHALAPKLKVSGAETEKLFHEVEMPLVGVLADMEYRGVMIDAASLKKLSKEIEGKLLDLQGRIRAAAGVDFNQDSPRQLADVLFKQLKLPIIKKTKVGPSTDITVLEKLADKHPVPALIVEYRQLAKLKNTYLDSLSALPNDRTGRVHGHFNQTVAETGRLSSSDPNLQNIPIKTELGREIRRAFVAAPGHRLISADYSQVELRMLAHYCGEKALVEAFSRDVDVHRLVAAELNHVAEKEVTPEMRAVAKTVNFGIIYGQTGFGLAQVLKIPRDQAEQYITAYRRRFPAIEQFTHECIQQATAYGHVATILGRRRALPDINSAVQSRRQFSQRAALNSVIQGSAADLIKLAMVHLHHKLENRNSKSQTRAGIILQIHDELVLECPTEEVEEVSQFVRAEMETAMKLKVPLKVDLGVGQNWVEME